MVLSIRELTDVLLQYLDEAIYRKDKTKVETVINERFLVRDNFLDTAHEDVFINRPSALIELFAILGENDKIEGIRASAIRQIRLHRNLIDDKFRADPENRELFMRLLRAPNKLSIQLAAHESLRHYSAATCPNLARLSARLSTTYSISTLSMSIPYR